ncbi:MAG TPA: CpsD/CapB family tyrosine-protein kinase [Candidatus Angelobacter sp.]|jgi:capsular exopolysaccharide synthesis family protein|nr:CpsD/CapB family tyrosine-protein kinase [Candidatus Angelobacter sp.]
MSKFFNETRSVQPITPSPAPAEINIQELVGSLRQPASTNGSAAQTEADLKHLLKPLKESHDAAGMIINGRLDKCRSIRLPRNEEKSFLVTQYNPAMQAAVEAYRTLRTRLVKQQTRNGTRSLVISSAAPGEGKTLTSFNLALCYANIQNWPVLLVDADLRTRGLSQLAGDPESAGLAGILEGSASYQNAVLRTDVPNLYVLPAGETTASPSELFSTAGWKEFIGWAAETFRMVIVDSPPILNLADFELLLSPCESTILVARARKTSQETLSRALSQVDLKKLAGVVFNSAENRGDKGYYRYSASAKANR